MSNLPSPEDLMRRACEVRDEDQAQANTAQRVGALLCDLVTTVSSALPLTSWRVTRTVAALSVEYTVPAADGTAVKLSLELPAATTAQAGVMSAADKRAVDNMPRPQDTASATADSRRYVYSVDNPDAKNSVLNAPDTLIKQVNGQLMFQKGLWNPLGQAIYYTRGRIPLATAGADGAMAREVFARLGADYPLREYQPTTVKVPIIYPDWAAGGTRTFDLQPATSARAGVMTAADKEKLDGYPAAGDFVFLTNEELLVEADAVTIYAQTASGDSEQGLMIKAATQEQAGVMSAADKRALDNMPRPQDTASATAAARRYVYSVNDAQAKDSVLNAPDTLFRQVNGQLMLQKGIWNPLGQAIYYTNSRVPVATAVADGALSKEVFARLGSGGTIREYQPTTVKVPIAYPDWAAGGTRTFELLPATSARAGVMTAEDKEKLDAASGVRALVYKSATESIESLSAGSDSDTIKAVFGGAADLSDAWNALRAGRALLFRTNGTGTARLIAPALADISQLLDTGGHRLALRFLTATEIKSLTVVCEGGTWRIE
ncbi:MAG: hypothetical protein IJY00_05720 [Bacteroidaceae bacterium]|nr:hypothetical protein [Bacteroidaceae bacterium]